MLMRASQQPVAAPGSYSHYSRASPARFDDSNSSDTQAKRRFQRSTSMGDGKSVVPSAVKQARDARPMTAGKGQNGGSTDYRAGPAPDPAMAAFQFPQHDDRHAAPAPSSNGNGTYSFYRESDDADLSSLSFEFPEINFDDLHQSLSINEQNNGSFPTPGGASRPSSHIVEAPKPLRTRNTSPQKIGRSNSIARKSSLVNRTRPTAGQDGQSTIRARRQSAFPVAPMSTTSSRSPRKSIAVSGEELTVRAVHSQRPSVIQRSTEGSLHGTVISSNPTPTTQTGERKFLSVNRAARAKSLQPPPRQGQTLGDDLVTPEGPRSARLSTMLSPRSPAQRTHTPSSNSSKRLSQIPPHATGLGARTISPTDARRMKRLSSVQPPPMPNTPQTPQPDFASSRSATHSPSMIPLKTSTPSSSRNTPEPGRKNLAGSIGSQPPSARTSTGSLQKMLQNASASRLPMAKSRIQNGSPDEEDVPPVPAIPKAFESPKDVYTEAPFFSQRKSSLPFDTSSVTSNSSAAVEKLGSSIGSAGFSTEYRLQKPSTSNDSDRRQVGSAVTKKNLQPLRLPPLNLLPLGTPMLNRVARMQESEPAPEEGRITPPRRSNLRTPSTPMTASKLSFFSKNQGSDNEFPFQQHGRSASTHLLASDAGFMRPTSSSSSSMVATNSRHGRQTISPFVTSSSFSKNSIDFGYARPMTSSEYPAGNIVGDLRSSRMSIAPRPPTKTMDDVKPLPPSPTPDTPSSGNSVRRKLSLSWKRSSSKASSSTEAQSEQAAAAAKNAMPPPKLPAPATINGQLTPSPSPSSNRPPVFANSKLGKPPPIIPIHHRTESWASQSTATSSPKKETKSADRVTSGILSPMHKILGKVPGKKPVIENVQPQREQQQQTGPVLDSNDSAAEEEMRKLALRRKDTERAAAEMDALTKRAIARDSMTPDHALRTISLNIFERGEIVDFKDVYFCGTPQAKKHIGDLSSQASNFGYDDERGDYGIVTGDHLAYRYEIIDVLGKGSFGQVVRCIDHKTGGLVAIKIIRNKKRFHQQALVEVNILQKLRDWDPEDKHGMVSFTQSFYFRGHLCISTELLGMNLYEFIKCNEFRGFSLRLIRRFTRQLLNSLILLQKQRVIHCDLKPENVLLCHPARSEIKVIDFGSSCFESEKVYTYIQSRFYRSPEVILGMSYGLPIDMWSLGCILAELYTGYPIFPGENEQEQLACIMEIFGPPEKHLIEKSTRRKLFFDSLGKPRPTVSSKGRRRRPSSKTLSQAIKCDDEAFLDFVTRCLRWDPERRLKADDALLHEFCTGIRRPRGRAAQPESRHRTLPVPNGSRPLPDPAVHIKPLPVRGQRVSPTKLPPKRHSVATTAIAGNLKKGQTSTVPAIGPRGTSRGPHTKSQIFTTGTS